MHLTQGCQTSTGWRTQMGLGVCLSAGVCHSSEWKGKSDLSGQQWQRLKKTSTSILLLSGGESSLSTYGHAPIYSAELILGSGCSSRAYVVWPLLHHYGIAQQLASESKSAWHMGLVIFCLICLRNTNTFSTFCSHSPVTRKEKATPPSPQQWSLYIGDGRTTISLGLWTNAKQKWQINLHCVWHIVN